MGLFGRTKSEIRASGNLTQQSLLDEQSIYDFRVMNNVDFNRKRYETLLQEQDKTEYCNRYTWEGLPNGIDGERIESQLYYRGAMCGYYEGGYMYILPYAISGNLNKQGFPTSVNIINFNSQKMIKKDLPINYYGNLVKGKNSGCLLFDRNVIGGTEKPLSRMVLNEVLVKDMANVLAHIKNNVENSDKKIVFYCDNENQKRIFFKSIADSYSSNLPFIVMVKNKLENGGVESEPFHTDVELQTQQLFETYQSLNNLRCQCEGIDTGSLFMKKERMITDESSGNANQTNLTLDGGLRMRKLFIEQMKTSYPEYIDELNKIKVYITGQGDNKIEKEEVEDNGDK